MSYIPEKLRQQVIKRAQGRCEYCQTQQVIVVAMEIDHIIPEASDGQSTLENLCLACIGCNGFKYSFQTGIDPTTGIESELFNPRSQLWSDNFKWSDDGLEIIGLTPTGRATVNRLRMNRDAIMKSRQRWVQAGWHPPNDKD